MSSSPSHDRAVDEGRQLRVAIIGAGVSGICTYIRLRQYVPSAQITIFEKNAGLGGTWFENRYPGVACDIPSHSYQYTFEPNTQWSKFFSPGSEILDYVQGVAKKFQVDESVQYNSKVSAAEWDDARGLWTIGVTNTNLDHTQETKQVEAEVVISATGALNNWKFPEVAGLANFEGKLLHSANWDMDW
jgi:cation diffusion facilitator CzcD-associated flavoprotein CzcO